MPYDAYEEKQVKKTVTEYMIDHYMPDCRSSRIIGLFGENPIDLPIMYGRGRIGSSTAIYNIQKTLSGHGSLGRTAAKHAFFDGILRQNIEDAIGNSDLDGCISTYHGELVDFVPEGLYRFAYIDTCSFFSERMKWWIVGLFDHIEDNGCVVVNFTLNRYHVDGSTVLPRCDFRHFNLPTVEIQQNQKRFIAQIANILIGAAGRRKILLECALAYRNKTKGNEMGMLVFRKRLAKRKKRCIF